MGQNLPRGTPARVLVLLTLLTGLVVVSVWRDALRRDRDLWTRHPTALGDRGFLLPGHLPAQLEIKGQWIHLTAGPAALSRRDDRMFRIETGSPLPFTLFSPRETLDAGSGSDPRFYGRTAPGQYLRLKPRHGPVPPQPTKTDLQDAPGSPPPLSPVPGIVVKENPLIPDQPLSPPTPPDLPADAPENPPLPKPSPKAIPLPPEEQDFPVAEGAAGTL